MPFKSKKVPRHNTEGEKNRLQRLVHQVPLSDVSVEMCRFVEPESIEDAQAYIEKLQNTYLRLGTVQEWSPGMSVQCPKCLLILEPEDLVVQTLDSDGPCYHPNCFECFQCNCFVADLIYCVDIDGTIFCVRHFGETFKKRCYACDELIFSSRMALAGDKYYHHDHLMCFACEEALPSSQGFQKEGELYCSRCYEERFAKDCFKCQEQISVDRRHVTFRNDSWHYDCFTCHDCAGVISDSSFEMVEDNFYCPDCYTQKFAPKCHECSEVFEPRAKVVKFEDKIYHVTCFKCVDCTESIGTGSFVPQNGSVYCKACHLRNFGVHCFRCKYVITDDRGIRYNKQPYHEGCFTCSKCSTRIGSRPFKSVEEEWYCMNCYADSFCKKCHSCGEPILLGTDQEVLYSYQDYRWHAACFICSECKKSLADTLFTINDNILVCDACKNGKSSRDDIIEAAEESSQSQQETESK